jgi:excisionase family DNA binding protein
MVRTVETRVTPDLSPAGPCLLVVSEVADLLRTSPKAIYAMAERNQLPGTVRIGRRLLFHREELLEWLHQKSAPSPRSER